MCIRDSAYVDFVFEACILFITYVYQWNQRELRNHNACIISYHQFQAGITYPDIIEFNFTMTVDPLALRLIGSRKTNY